MNGAAMDGSAETSAPIVLRFGMLMRNDREPPSDPPRRENDVTAWAFFIVGVAMLAAIVAAATIASR